MFFYLVTKENSVRRKSITYQLNLFESILGGGRLSLSLS